VDWDGIYTRRLAARCRQAAGDLGLEVQAPFELQINGSTIVFVAYFPHFVSPRGVLIALSSCWGAVHEAAGAAGYACVGLNPDHLSVYSLDQWRNIITQWGWHGAPGACPLPGVDS
jgi:hypothetical protein